MAQVFLVRHFTYEGDYVCGAYVTRPAAEQHLHALRNVSTDAPGVGFEVEAYHLLDAFDLNANPYCIGRIDEPDVA
jgi:hypothetical protein